MPKTKTQFDRDSFVAAAIEGAQTLTQEASAANSAAFADYGPLVDRVARAAIDEGDQVRLGEVLHLTGFDGAKFEGDVSTRVEELRYKNLVEDLAAGADLPEDDPEIEALVRRIHGSSERGLVIDVERIQRRGEFEDQAADLDGAREALREARELEKAGEKTGEGVEPGRLRRAEVRFNIADRAREIVERWRGERAFLYI